MDDQALPSQALARAKKALAKNQKGGASALAAGLGITPQALGQWQQVPPLRVLEVERLTGVPRWQLRPDLYPAPETAEAS